MTFRPIGDYVRRWEWRCGECGCINEEDEFRCWSCDCDRDGNPRAPDEGSRVKDL